MNYINITQGHEDSIGLEVFIKSFLSIDSKNHSKFRLFTHKDVLEKHLKVMKLQSEITDDTLSIANSKLNLVLLKDSDGTSSSFNSLLEAERNTRKGDILFTLPTTKNSLKDKDNIFSGHTDYFRQKYLNANPVMLFKSETYFMALLTEHIGLKEVEKSISTQLVLDKLKVLVDNPYFQFHKFIFSGINPHCGEEGLLGSSDELLKDSINTLKERHPKISFSGPISGDTVFLDSRNEGLNTCIICAQHDQGLGSFKSISGLQASNITLGLPFLRLSPDHGTAFDLYGKNKANYLGTLYTIKLALKNLGTK